MVTLTRAYTDEEITEATRLLLKMRDNCVRKNTDKYDDPLRKEKYNALIWLLMVYNTYQKQKGSDKMCLSCHRNTLIFAEI